MSGSSVNAGAVALASTFSNAGVAGLGVTLGPAWDPPLLALEVAYAGSNTPGVTVVRRSLDYGNVQNMEKAQVHCLLSFHDGTQPVDVVSGSLSDAFDALDGALFADSRLGGAAMFAQVVEMNLMLDRTESGEDAALHFVVELTVAK